MTTKFDHRTFNKIILACHQRHVNAAKRSLEEIQCQRIFGCARNPAFPHPGQIPPAVANDDSAAEARTKESNFKLFLLLDSKFNIQEIENVAYKSDLLDISSAEALASITHGVTGTNHLLAANILQLYYDAFGTITAETIAEAKLLLPTSIPDVSAKSVQIATNELRQYFDLNEAAGCAISENDKIVQLSKLLPQEFDIVNAIYDQNFALLIDRTFTNYSNAMISASKRFRPRLILNANSAVNATGRINVNASVVPTNAPNSSNNQSITVGRMVQTALTAVKTVEANMQAMWTVQHFPTSMPVSQVFGHGDKHWDHEVTAG